VSSGSWFRAGPSSSPGGWLALTYTNLHVHLLGEAQEALNRTPERSATPRMDRPALTAIILAAAAIEAAVNHCVAISFPPPLLLREHRPNEWLSWLAVDQARSPKDKLRLLAVRLRTKFDAGAEPWMSAGDVGKLRNSLVHYEAHPVIENEGATFPVEKLRSLAERLGLFPIQADHNGTWLDVFGNRDCAKWAVDTADAVLRTLNRKPWRQVGTMGPGADVSTASTDGGG
jgi:hypothetical protein